MSGEDDVVIEPVLSEEALLQSMISALNILEEKKRGPLTPERITEFLGMLYQCYFEDSPSAMEEKIKEFIAKIVLGEAKS